MIVLIASIIGVLILITVVTVLYLRKGSKKNQQTYTKPDCATLLSNKLRSFENAHKQLDITGYQSFCDFLNSGISTECSDLTLEMRTDLPALIEQDKGVIKFQNKNGVLTLKPEDKLMRCEQTQTHAEVFPHLHEFQFKIGHNGTTTTVTVPIGDIPPMPKSLA